MVQWKREWKTTSLHYSCLENLMNSMKRQNDMILKDELPRSVGALYMLLEKGMPNHFSILALRTSWTVWKGNKMRRWKRNSPGWLDARCAAGDQWRNSDRRVETRSQSENSSQLRVWLLTEAAQEPGMSGPRIQANRKWSNRRWQEWTSTA